MTKRNNWKPLTLLIFSICATGCSNGGVSGSTATGSIQGITSQNKVGKIAISRTSVIPTNYDAAGSHLLKVDNLSDEAVSLDSFYVSSTAKDNFLKQTFNTLNAILGGDPKSANVNLIGCSNLAPGGSCMIKVTPDATDGSTAVQLIYKTESGKLLKAAQLVEYSSHVNKMDGFLVSNENIENIGSTDKYSISIPFVADDDYTKIEVNSRVINYGTSVDCENGATKGSHCTAVVTLPAGPATSYNNLITLKGTKADGSIRTAALSSGNTYNDFAHLVMYQGPLVINSGTGFSGTIRLVNDGAVTATGIKDKLINGQGWLNGLIDNFDNLNKEITCDGKKLTSLPEVLNNAAVCEIKLSLKNIAGTGVSDYALSYARGSSGTAPIETFAKVYYLGDEVPPYSFRVDGNLAFTGIRVNTTVSKSVTIFNQGKNQLKDIGLKAGTSLPENIQIDYANSDCQGKVLDAGNSCNITFKYSPTKEIAVTDNEINFTASPASGSDSVPQVPRTIRYSSVADGKGGKGVVFVPGKLGFAIFADNKDKIATNVQIQNVGEVSYILNEVTNEKSLTADIPLKIEVPAKLSDGTTANPFASKLTFTTTGGAELPSPISLPASGIGELIYTFGSTDKVIAPGEFKQMFKGSFAGTDDFDTSFITRYKATSSTVKVDKEITIPTKDPTGENSFVLTSKNLATAKFTYSFTDDTPGFLVNDNSLPFGWIADKSVPNLCPLSSLGNVGVNKTKGSSCVAVYKYLSPELKHHLYYTAAANGNKVKIMAPSIIVKGSTDVGINVVRPGTSSELTITPKPFAAITVTKTQDPVNKNIFDLKFTLNSFDGIASLPGSSVIVKPIFNTSLNYPSGSLSTCTLTTKGSICSIQVALTAAADTDAKKTLPLVYSSSTDGDYNAISSSIILK